MSILHNNPKKILSDDTIDELAFLSPPDGAIIYYGFPLIQETEKDGYIYGAITDFLEPDTADGCTFGDGFIQAPDGTRAGLIWEIAEQPYVAVNIPPEEDRWGVYNIGFNRSISSIEDLVENFHTILPLLKEIKEQL